MQSDSIQFGDGGCFALIASISLLNSFEETIRPSLRSGFCDGPSFEDRVFYDEPIVVDSLPFGEYEEVEIVA